jgi:hypothetical protein
MVVRFLEGHEIFQTSLGVANQKSLRTPDLLSELAGANLKGFVTPEGEQELLGVMLVKEQTDRPKKSFEREL